MSTSADKFRDFCLAELGSEYQWGEEGTGGSEGADEYDCSGFFWAALKASGVKLPRLTANDYYKKGAAIAAPEKVGDFFVLLSPDGHAHHIGCYIGLGETAEARGEKWGVVRYKVAQVNARGAIWLRLPGVDLGELTPASDWTPAALELKDYGLLRGYPDGLFHPEREVSRAFMAEFGLKCLKRGAGLQ